MWKVILSTDYQGSRNSRWIPKRVVVKIDIIMVSDKIKEDLNEVFLLSFSLFNKLSSFC